MTFDNLHIYIEYLKEKKNEKLEYITILIKYILFKKLIN